MFNNDRIETWCQVSNLFLNFSKTKKLMNFSNKQKINYLPLTINRIAVERVDSFR